MKLGLVLNGGGARGAYQIGVLKALNELKINEYITGISGVSIGALNGIFFAQDDMGIAEKIWENITLEKVLPTDNIDILTRGLILSLGCKRINFVKKHMPKILEKGNLSREWLIEVIDNYLDIKKIRLKKRICYATCTELPNLNVKYFKINDHSKEEIKNILLATSALPIIYQSEKVKEKKYLDGAISDNIPVQPLYQEGFDIIIVVHLSKEGIINRSRFPNSKFIEIRPKSQNFSIDDTLDFNLESIRSKVKEGYWDTLDLFEPIIEIIKYKMKKLPNELINVFRKEIKEKSLKVKRCFKG